MNEGQILFACQSGDCYFKLTGELRYTNAIGMDNLIERLFYQEKPICSQIIVDLNEASFLDSTYIGLLASLARHCQQHQLSRPMLFSSNAEINQLLKGLCLDKVFDFIEHSNNKIADLDPVQTDEYTDKEKGQMILKAHQNLLDLSDSNKLKFEPIVRLLQQEID